MANPALILGGLSAAGSIYNQIRPDEASEIQKGVLRDMQERRLRLNRMARGKFTGQEQQSIVAGAEPGLNRLAGNLAQRGLGQSGAGAQLLAEASVQPFADARNFAEVELGRANMQALDASQLLAADDSFFDDIEGIAQGYFQLEELGADQDDGLLNSVLSMLNQMTGANVPNDQGYVHGGQTGGQAYGPGGSTSQYTGGPVLLR